MAREQICKTCFAVRLLWCAREAGSAMKLVLLGGSKEAGWCNAARLILWLCKEIAKWL